jgi:hypothetical protein
VSESVVDWGGRRIDYLKFTTMWTSDQFALYVQHALTQYVEQGGSVETWSKAVKITVLPPAGKRTSELRIFEVRGPEADRFRFLGKAWHKYLTRIDVKSYIAFNPNRSAEELFTNMWNSPTLYNLTLFSAKRESKNVKDSGRGGIRIGDMKSDMFVVIYRRRGQPYALEMRCQDKILYRLTREASSIATSKVTRYNDVFWEQMVDRVFDTGFERVIKSIEAAGYDSASTLLFVKQKRRVYAADTGLFIGLLDYKGDLLVRD